MRTDCDEDGLITLLLEIGKCEVPTDCSMKFQFHAKAQDGIDFESNELAWKAVFRNTEPQHSSGNRLSFKDRYFVSQQGKVVGAGKPCGSSSNDSDFDSILLDGFAEDLFEFIEINHAFNTVSLADEALEGSNRDWRIKFCATASRLTRRRADSSTNRCKRVRPSSNVISLFVLSFLNEGNIPSSFRVDRTCRHTGKIGIEPLKVNECELVRHAVGFSAFVFAPKRRELRTSPQPRAQAQPL